MKGDTRTLDPKSETLHPVPKGILRGILGVSTIARMNFRQAASGAGPCGF